MINLGGILDSFAMSINEQILKEMYSRGAEITKAMRNAEVKVLSGQRSGRMYGKHQASAPGEPPAVRSGKLRQNWSEEVQQDGNTVKARISSNMFYSVYLEGGTSKMAPRPFADKIAEEAMPKIIRIYRKPFPIDIGF